MYENSCSAYLPYATMVMERELGRIFYGGITPQTNLTRSPWSTA